jgi:hypothetical protein
MNFFRYVDLYYLLFSYKYDTYQDKAVETNKTQ